MRGFFFHHNNSPHGEAKDGQEICILFEDPAIQKIFAQLLVSRGYMPRIINDVSEIAPQMKVISEANYFIHLDRDTQSRCLVVGNNSNIQKVAPLCLTQPLTEEKVEAALEEFFRM